MTTTDQCGLMDYYVDDELASLLGEDYASILSPVGRALPSSPPSSNVPAAAAAADVLPICLNQPGEQQKTTEFSSFPSFDDVANLNFGKVDLPSSLDQRLFNRNDVAFCGNEPKHTKLEKRKSRTRAASETYDHIIAERKRRELLSQRFIALSALVPGLKKMDKTSVLGDAIKYMKQLQEKVKTMEEQVAKHTMESVVLVKKSQLTMDNKLLSDGKSWPDDQPLPEVEARVCNKSVLLKIHCQKRKGVLVRALSAVEKLDLTVISTGVAYFGSSALEITIAAEMEKNFDLSTEVIVRTIRAALRQAGE